ncbi:MAG: class I SAM-dependent methyltransferase [Candidatus Brocadiia bacterium]
MPEIRLGRRKTPRRAEEFADGRLKVLSPKGVRRTECALLEALPRGKGGLAVVVNSTEALAGLALRALNPAAAVHCHFDDAWDFEAAQAAARRHPRLAPELGLAPDPPDGPWDLAVLPTEAAGETELLRERLDWAAEHLRPGGLLVASTDNRRDRALRQEILGRLGAATEVPGPTRSSGVAYIAPRPRDLKLRKRDRERTFTVREGERVLRFVSRPGVFCHGKLDDGTRALLATVEMGQAQRVLDLGCGVGVLGAVAAIRCPQARVTLVDSSARAIHCAQRSLAALGLADRCTTVLTAHAARDLEPGFDLVLSNPPYYGNYRISERFLDAAARVLVPGGSLALVTKGVEWHRQAMEQRFEAVEVQERGGYAVLTARAA